MAECVDGRQKNEWWVAAMAECMVQHEQRTTPGNSTLGRRLRGSPNIGETFMPGADVAGARVGAVAVAGGACKLAAFGRGNEGREALVVMLEGVRPVLVRDVIKVGDRMHG
jgi:hypothetical protein